MSAANLMAAMVDALMYFATLTEVPIVQALRGAGMGEGPSLALLLAGPALSLPNMLAIHGIMATRRAVYVGLVVVMATVSGLILRRYRRLRRTTMLEIKVFGTGCAKCNRLAANAEVAARELGLKYQIENITDADAIIVMITPALVINGQIKVAGKAPSPGELQMCFPSVDHPAHSRE